MTMEVLRPQAGPNLPAGERASHPTSELGKIMDYGPIKTMKAQLAIEGLIATFRNPENPSLESIQQPLNIIFGAPDLPIQPGSQQELIRKTLATMWETDPFLAKGKLHEDIIREMISLNLVNNHGPALAALLAYDPELKPETVKAFTKES